MSENKRNQENNRNQRLRHLCSSKKVKKLLNKRMKTWEISGCFSVPWRRWTSVCCCILWGFCGAGPESAPPLSGAHPPAGIRPGSARCSDPEGRWTRRRSHRSPPPPAGLSPSNLQHHDHTDTNGTLHLLCTFHTTTKNSSLLRRREDDVDEEQRLVWQLTGRKKQGTQQGKLVQKGKMFIVLAR